MSSLSSFDASFSFEKSISILTSLSRHLLPSSHPLIRMIEAKDWLALAQAEVNYVDHLDQSTVKAERQVLAFFSKNASLPLGINRREVALEKMTLAERDCAVTNWRIRNRRFESERLDAGLLAKIQWKIASILGPVPDLSEFPFSFGPGANVGTRRLTSARAKLSTKPTYTANAAPLVEWMRAEFPHWDFLHVAEVHDYGKLAFVPKDAKTDRSIETQPLINAFLQCGVGTFMKQRLALHGCDLRHGQAVNAEYARRGSLDGSFATIDLSSASDTISSLLVLELLPPEWFSLLDMLRTPKLKNGREFISLHRFSAMGNGYTFELESLIFYAACKAVCGDEEVKVYGDDIIVPTHHAARVIEVLEGLGFTVNSRKSYTSGRFRESCGKDFFDGVDVRPCYVKGPLSVKELFRLHNFFWRRGMAFMANECKRHIQKRWLSFTGPDGFGDGHLLSLAPALVPHGRDRGWAGWTFRTVSAKPNKDYRSLRGDYAAFLYLTSKSTGGGLIEDDPPQPTRTMYTERGCDGWRVRRIYTLRG